MPRRVRCHTVCPRLELSLCWKLNCPKNTYSQIRDLTRDVKLPCPLRDTIKNRMGAKMGDEYSITSYNPL